MKCPNCNYEHPLQEVVFVMDDENASVQYKHIKNKCPDCSTTFMTVEAWKLIDDKYEENDDD